MALGAEPYKCDNAKLIRECNELHLAFIQFKEKHEKIEEGILVFYFVNMTFCSACLFIDLRSQIIVLENQLKVCTTDRQKLKKNLADLEIRLVNTRIKGKLIFLN